ncbi:hypothetical protein P175DRAFT_0483191 [Aspergillus ochraceoroseus IBT 24754]|uniref:DUF7702 domain-containing protein n=2 Tax=Aspergillus ochraceoroseus TaxID=138278 RepID=A0A2T5LTJ7_9EURO|nr:uncharacterized protein P175DRAFT_0483191 [Aspergillus ochraceoroseus IBT 24754]KKK22786.1 hypothetical protein AOCH_006374 [Aspergillus ochraceoroseus]PTU19598.1 hypothetical protein P175DRAFT_0483191 [Aspergillus ochraceoroseus IBT 24754]
MNWLFVADLVLYIILLPLTVYNLWTHLWAGFLAWYYLGVFCAVRVIAGGLGAGNSDTMVASILIGVGTSPLILTVDGLVHEARVLRNPTANPWIGWGFVALVTGVSGAGVGLSVSGALDIYNGHPKPNSLGHWQAGAALFVAAWALEVIWALLSLLPFNRARDAPRGRDGTLLLHASFVALVFIGIRVIYTLIFVCTQRMDLSPITGTTAVRAVLIFLPEALAALMITIAGLKSRNRLLKVSNSFEP